MEAIQQIFYRVFKRHVQVRLQENRCRMAKLALKGEKQAKLSLHRCFFDAPREIIEALALYFKSKDRPSRRKLQHFLHTHAPSFKENAKCKLSTEGRHHDLESLAQNVSRRYFSGAPFFITWFGRCRPRFKSRIVFGSYTDCLRLIKVHRILDSPDVPHYFVSFVIYHEMLHHFFPPVLLPSGRWQQHGAQFKQEEKKFEHFHLAQDWLKQHKPLFFIA